MIVDDVQDHLDAGVVQSGHGRTEIRDRVAGSVTRFRGKKTQCVVAPIIFQPAVQQIPVVKKGVDGQQFDRAHAELAQARDCPGLRQAAKRSASLRR